MALNSSTLELSILALGLGTGLCSCTELLLERLCLGLIGLPSFHAAEKSLG
jgi:hypothetical protein